MKQEQARAGDEREEQVEEEEEEKEEDVSSDLSPDFSSDSHGEEEWRQRDLPRPFEYNLARMLPLEGSRNRVLLKRRLYLDLARHDVIVKKYVVLNMHGLFFYDSRAQFRNLPESP